MNNSFSDILYLIFWDYNLARGITTLTYKLSPIFLISSVVRYFLIKSVSFLIRFSIFDAVCFIYLSLSTPSVEILYLTNPPWIYSILLNNFYMLLLKCYMTRFYFRSVWLKMNLALSLSPPNNYLYFYASNYFRLIIASITYYLNYFNYFPDNSFDADRNYPDINVFVLNPSFYNLFYNRFTSTTLLNFLFFNEPLILALPHMTV